MPHPSALRLLLPLLLLLPLIICGCDNRPRPAPSTTRPSASPLPTVASVVPAATDILLQINARPQLIAISNVDPATPDLAGLPRIGDFLSLDWEQLTNLRPSVLIIPRPKDDLTDPLRQRAAALGITLLPVHSDRLEDILPIITRVGQAISQPAAAAKLCQSMTHDLDALRHRLATEPKVRTLMVVDEGGQYAVGPNNFLNDLLTIAGGENVAAPLARDYAKVDREKILQLNPDAVIVLIPDAPPQVIAAAKRFWSTLPDLPAVKAARIYVHSDSFLLLPSAKVALTAQIIARDLHPHPLQDIPRLPPPHP